MNCLIIYPPASRLKTNVTKLGFVDITVKIEPAVSNLKVHYGVPLILFSELIVILIKDENLRNFDS